MARSGQSGLHAHNGHLKRSAPDDTEVGYQPGRVDVYADFYVAATWNISRVTRCFLIDLIIRIPGIIGDTSALVKMREAARCQITGNIASIPYHLSDNIQTFLHNAHTREAIDPERSAGSLLLMHPLYVLSRISITPRSTRGYLLSCFSWIGRHMGICQATVLAQNCDIDVESITSAWMILSAALLV
ncbi:hypothetical protein BJX70DRAFT_339574 [Aspergillus crustosus]